MNINEDPDVVRSTRNAFEVESGFENRPTDLERCCYDCVMGILSCLRSSSSASQPTFGNHQVTRIDNEGSSVRNVINAFPSNDSVLDSSRPGNIPIVQRSPSDGDDSVGSGDKLLQSVNSLDSSSPTSGLTKRTFSGSNDNIPKSNSDDWVDLGKPDEEKEA
jgi:hypothetical protein